MGGAPFFVPMRVTLSVMSPAFAIESISAQSSSDSITEAREMLLEYGRFVMAAEGLSEHWFAKLEGEARGLPEFFAGHGGAMLVARVDGLAAGCVTYRALPDIAGGCEMKRLWVRDEFRGLGLGERLVQALMESAADAGYEAVYCDTIPASMGSAYRMYLRLGFVACEPYHPDFMEGMVFLRQELKQGAGAGV
ncbi:hypothetical protein GCM10011586_17080 [Silvibacterium dinghuense]|nr:hypothetical protein GCM10011586_17080 [Silvibacterium dinghuense]